MLYWGSEEKKDEAREMLPVVHTVRHNVRKPRFKPHSPLRAPWLGHFACPFWVSLSSSAKCRYRHLPREGMRQWNEMEHEKVASLLGTKIISSSSENVAFCCLSPNTDHCSQRCQFHLLRKIQGLIPKSSVGGGDGASLVAVRTMTRVPGVVNYGLR